MITVKFYVLYLILASSEEYDRLVVDFIFGQISK